jgi:hypothetical protein
VLACGATIVTAFTAAEAHDFIFNEEPAGK